MSEVQIASIRKNSLYGVIGFVVSTLMVIGAFPVLIGGLGQERFGIYTLANSVSGALGFLDFGLAAATIKFTAEYHAKGDYPAMTEVLSLSLYFCGIMGIVVGAALFSMAPWMLSLFSVNTAVYEEALFAFRVAGVQIGIALFFNVLLSVAKALQRFDVSAKLVSLLSVATLGSAVAMVTMGAGLRGVMVSSLVGYLVLVGFASWIVKTLLQGKAQFCLVRLRPPVLRRMFGYGSYITINSIATSLVYPMQRVLVGYFLGPSSVTFYAVAFAPASKIHAIVQAAAEVMFPFSSAAGRFDEIKPLYRKMLGGSLVFGLLACLPLALLSAQILEIWAGVDVARQSGRLLAILAFAYFFLSLTPAPYFLLDGLGRPRMNTFFLSMHAALNIAFVALQYPFGLTLESFGYAFLAANGLLATAYLLFIEKELRKGGGECLPVGGSSARAVGVQDREV